MAEGVWRGSHIPRKLEEVVHYERDHARLQTGTDTGVCGRGQGWERGGRGWERGEGGCDKAIVER